MQTEAQRRAKARYNKKAYKQFAVRIKKDDFDKIDTFCKNNNISKAALLVNAVGYCIDNNIILTDTQQDSTGSNDG